MEYKVLYRKYRPQDFDSLVGQEYTKTLLKNSIINNKISHAYIFTGPRGTGKTSSAKIFSKAINCLHPVNGNPCNECEMCKNFNTNPDIVEIDAASNNGVDEIREIINNVRLAPSISKYKVYIIDEFHMLSTSAFNALLLTLEEPPSNVVFILATTDIQSVPITVLSRCQRFDYKPIEIDDIISRLKYVCSEENIDIDDAALHEIAFMSNGGMRDALSILDQISSKDGTITVDDVTSNFGSISSKKLDLFIQYLENNDVSGLLSLLDGFEKDGIDVRILIEKLIESLKNVIINIKLDKYDGMIDFDDVYNLIFDLNQILSQMKSNVNPYIFLQIVLLKYFPGNNPVDKNMGNIVKKEEKINNFPGNNVKKEEKVDNFSGNDEKTEVKNNNFSGNSNIQQDKIKDDVVEEKVTIESNDSNFINNNTVSFNVKARINNTFVNPKKTYLNDIKSKWEDFVIYESNANKQLMSYIMDTDIVAASDCYAIVTNSDVFTNDLINQNIESLEKDFRIFFNKSYKLVSISSKMWDTEKANYAKNLKSGFKYSMMDDSIVIQENSSELDKIANEIFGNNYDIK